MKEPETDFTDFESEDFNYDDCQECQFCGGSDEHGHMQGCPESNNPFHQLLKDGYDILCLPEGSRWFKNAASLFNMMEFDFYAQVKEFQLLLNE